MYRYYIYIYIKRKKSFFGQNPVINYNNTEPDSECAEIRAQSEPRQIRFSTPERENKATLRQPIMRVARRPGFKLRQPA